MGGELTGLAALTDSARQRGPSNPKGKGQKKEAPGSEGKTGTPLTYHEPGEGYLAGGSKRGIATHIHYRRALRIDFDQFALSHLSSL
jgi:hypothetical protein